MTGRLHVRGVLAGAYLGKSPKLDRCLTHVSCGPHWDDALCGRVRPGMLCDLEEPGPPTCKRCARIYAASICDLCGSDDRVSSRHGRGICDECNELNTCPICQHFTRYEINAAVGGGFVCSHCEPVEFKRRDEAGDLI
jgi:hypothetical protein